MNDGDDKRSGDSNKEAETAPETDRRPPMETVPLRPLTEVLPPGEEGARAFEQLMHAALEAWAQREGVSYYPARYEDGTTGGHVGAGTVLGLEGPFSFSFEGSSWVRDVARSLSDLGLEPAAGQRPSLDGSAPDDGKLGTRNDVATRQRVAVFFGTRRGPDSVPQGTFLRDGSTLRTRWESAQIEPLLRACPSLLIRHYPEEAESAIAGYDGLPLIHPLK